MKTVFLTSFHPHISRNILSTDVLMILRTHQDVRIVIITAAYKKEYFSKTFSGPNVVVEGVTPFQASKTKRGLFFKKLGVLMFFTQTARAHKKYNYYCTGKYGQYAAGIVMGFLGRSSFVRRVFRELDYRCSPKDFFAELFERYQPDLVFSTDIQNENDVSLAQDARRFKVPVLGMLRSWDNPTQRILRVWPQRLLVGSATLREEVITIYQYPAKRITVVGNPHYDRYLQGPTVSREEFCRGFGLDPVKPFILHAPVGDHLIRHNDVDEHILTILAKTGEQVLVRFPPDEGVRLPTFTKPSQMVYDRPGVAFSAKEFGDREISIQDDERLRNSLAYAALVISGPTSIPLDAALFDKPGIMVEMYPTPRGFCDAIYNYWYAHIRKIIQTGGIFYARSEKELIHAIRECLRNPHIKQEERKKIRAMWFSHADGHAGERIVKEVLTAAGV